jgi:hypothetical protein
MTCGLLGCDTFVWYIDTSIFGGARCRHVHTFYPENLIDMPSQTDNIVVLVEHALIDQYRVFVSHDTQSWLVCELLCYVSESSSRYLAQ